MCYAHIKFILVAKVSLQLVTVMAFVQGFPQHSKGHTSLVFQLQPEFDLLGKSSNTFLRYKNTLPTGIK